MAYPKGRPNPNAGRKGYGLEQREAKLRELAMNRAEDLMGLTMRQAVDEAKLMTPQQFETYITVLKRALKQRTEVTGTDGGPVKVEVQVARFGEEDLLQ